MTLHDYVFDTDNMPDPFDWPDYRAIEYARQYAGVLEEPDADVGLG